MVPESTAAPARAGGDSAAAPAETAAADGRTVIESDGLTKHFGDVVAVDDVSLSVRSGEAFGFLGHNGAGKSTTINMLLGFTRPTAGSATVLGHDTVAESARLRERIGVLPERFAVYDRLTGYEHLQHAIDIKGADDDPERLIERVGLTPDEADRKAGGYSTGMEQRLALGTALVGDPELLILDEPNSGLDPGGKQEIRDIIREAVDRGTTVFLSSHDLTEVEAVCDRVGIMSQGEMVRVDSLEGLRDEAGGGTRIELTVDAMPDTDLESLDGVTGVQRDGDTILADCESPARKVDVVTSVAADTAVLDIVSEEQSLEELFTSLTGER
jgi:ABC-2 type transport system ATP-binding protein